MDERRKFRRRYLMYYSRIFDKKTGSVLGYIVDLSLEGIMIISEEPIEPNTVYRLRMDLPDGIAQKTYLDFEARSVWCKKDIDPNFFDTGFQLLNVTEEDITLIELMIHEYGFRES